MSLGLIECTCDVQRNPVYAHAHGRTMSSYGVYLLSVDDCTRFDSACPFHGEHGSMVVRLDTR